VQIEFLDDLPLHSSEGASLDERVTVMQLAAFQTKPQPQRPVATVATPWMHQPYQQHTPRAPSPMHAPSAPTGSPSPTQAYKPQPTAPCSVPDPAIGRENVSHTANRPQGAPTAAHPGEATGQAPSASCVEAPNLIRKEDVATAKTATADVAAASRGHMTQEEWQVHEARLAALEASLLWQAQAAGNSLQQLGMQQVANSSVRHFRPALRPCQCGNLP
jgi:hypothetical protein